MRDPLLTNVDERPRLTDVIPVRPFRQSDRAFIDNAWRATLLIATPDADPGWFHAEMTRVLDRLFRTATCIVACDPKDEDELLGFACMTGPELHYTYVVGPMRRSGLVPAMLKGQEIKRMTFLTQPGKRRLKPKERGWLYTPRFTI